MVEPPRARPPAVPRTAKVAQATPPDDDSIAPGLGHHRQSIPGCRYVAVAEHRDTAHCRLQVADRPGTCRRSIVIECGTRVKGDRGGSLGFRDPTGVQVGQVIVIDTHAELHRHRHAASRFRIRGTDSGTDHPGQQLPLVGQSRTASIAGDLRGRATEVHVQMIDHSPAHELAAPPLRCSGHRCHRAVATGSSRTGWKPGEFPVNPDGPRPTPGQ